jgi:hypothetical protein
VKDLAKHLARAHANPAYRRKKQERSEAPTEEKEEKPPETPTAHLRPNEIPDAWDQMYRPDIEERALRARQELKRRKELEEHPDIDPEEQEDALADGFELVKRRRVSRRKRRVCSMGIAVSEEEEAILRAHVAKLDETFSSWARKTLFRAMGRRMPARPKRK